MEQSLGTTLGVGVDENTALVIYNVGKFNQYAEVNCRVLRVYIHLYASAKQQG